MTDVITVSAVTGAYALEPLKPSARVSGSTPAQESMHALALEARKADAEQHRARMNVVGPPALALFFLTAGQQGRQLQQATMQQAEEAYLDGRRGEAEEKQEEEGNSEDETQDGQSEDGPAEDFESVQAEILALPAPGDAS